MRYSEKKVYVMDLIAKTYDILRTEYWAFVIVLGVIFFFKYLAN